MARNVNADLSKGVSGGGSAEWSAVDGSDAFTFSWTNDGDYISLFKAFGGTDGGELDWSEGNNFYITAADLSGIATGQVFSVAIVANSKTFIRTMYSVGSKELTLTATSGNGFKNGDDLITAEDAKHITDVRIIGRTPTSGTASFNVSNVYVSISPRTTLTFDANGVATIDLSKIDVTGGATYNEATHTVTSNGTGGSIKVVFDRAYDFSNMLNGKIDYSGTDISTNLQFDGDNKDNSYYNSRYNPTFSDHLAMGLYRAVTGFTLHLKSDGTAGDMVLNSITFNANKMSVVKVTTDTPAESLTNYVVDENGNITASGKLNYSYGSAIETPLGDGSSLMDNYIDIDGYDELRIYTSDAVRVFLVNAAPAAGTNTTNGSVVYVQNSDYFHHNETEGYYYATVSDIKANNNGHAKVISVKANNWGATVTVQKVIAYKANPDYDFVVSGQYSADVSLDEITNSDASAVDCTTLTASNLSISTQNPNCVFTTSKDGILANTYNVAVGNTIASLVLTDGHSLKASAIDGRTATAATYSRTMSTTYGTICLPYAVTANSDVELYAIDKVENDVLVLAKCETLAAGTPAIVKNLSGNTVALTANNASLSGTLNSVSSNGTTMLGSYTNGTKVTDDNAYYIYNDKFYRRALATAETPEPCFYCDAFRAYFTVTSGNAAKAMALREPGGTPTTVDILTDNANGTTIEAIYNAAGVKLPGLQKGINMIRLNNGTTRTIIIK